MAEKEYLSAPTLETIARGVVVQWPEGQAAAPEIGPLGGISIGPGYLPGGGVIHIAVHHPDGTTMLLTMGGPAFNEFARAMNRAADRIAKGEFNRPEVMQ